MFFILEGISLGIDQRLLDAIKEYDNGMENVRMKATDIRDKIMQVLGFTKKTNEETGETSTSEIRVVHFHVTIHVDSPYFDTIEVCLSEGEAPTPDGDDEDTAKFNEFKRQMNRIRELFGV